MGRSSCRQRGAVIVAEQPFTCTDDGTTAECVNESATNITEVCNDIDDDCDGATDELFKIGGVGLDGEPWLADAGKHLGQSCGTGACVGGVVACSAGGGSVTCTTLDLATEESCNALDDDCDGDTDEDGACGPPCGLLGVPCPAGFQCFDAATVDGLQHDHCESDDGGSVWVPAGGFWMGCNTANSYEAANCSSSEKDGSGGSHWVDVPSFAIQRTEVSIEAYAACPASVGCAPNPLDSGPQTPATYVTWAQASAYCEWLPVQTGHSWRLCTESEWEKAARGGCETVEAVSALGCKAGMRVYPWSAPGDTAAATCDHAWMDDGGLGCGAGLVGTQVDSVPQGASPYGVLHMSGNVWEWVQDCHHIGGYSGAPADGSAWTGEQNECHASFGTTAHVRRGGSFVVPAWGVRAATRDPSVLAADVTGMRCCRTID